MSDVPGFDPANPQQPYPGAGSPQFQPPYIQPYPSPYAAPYGQPFAPPVAPGPMIWRERKVLVVPDGWNLPDRCIKCNAPTGLPTIKRKLYWHTPGLYALILISLLIYAIVAIIVRKNGTVHFAVCSRHRKQHLRRSLGSTFAALGGCVLIIMALVEESAALGIVGAMLLIGGLVYAVSAVPYVRPKKIENKFMWLLGCGEEFLSTFMEWPPRQ